MTAEEPPRAFDESRRLTGANRHYAVPAVTLVPLGPAALDGAAHGRWIARVLWLARRLGWPEPLPRVHAHGSGERAGVILAFAAPPAALFTATEVNEWAWECAAAEHSAAARAAFEPLHALQPQVAAEAGGGDPVAHFAARAQAERSAPLERLAAAAAAHGQPFMADDDTVTVGEGSGGRSWPRAALPLPLDVPWARLHPVPKLLVTGSNGKTTTTRLLAAIATEAGFTAGLCSTEGVWVGGARVAEGDYAGPAGARTVLRHPGVTAAVLETARGGILRRGLAVQQAEVALVTNVSADHFGEYGIHSVEDIAAAKLTVAHAVARPEGRGWLVLNGSDEPLLRTAVQLSHATAARWALFARQHDAPILAALRGQGGSTCGVLDNRLLLTHLGQQHDLGPVSAMPLALGGAAPYNLENLAAAALAAACVGWPLEAVSAVLARFGADPADNPGRLETWGWRGATVLVDYAHNPDGLAQLLRVAGALGPRRVGLLLGQAGNRDDAAIAELCRVAAGFRPERVVVKELPAMLRGRQSGEVPALIERSLRAAGLAPASIVREDDETQAALSLLAWSARGDVLVLPVHTAAAREHLTAVLRAG